MTDTPSRLARIAFVIERLDVPTLQLRIEMQIVEAPIGWAQSIVEQLQIPKPNYRADHRADAHNINNDHLMLGMQKHISVWDRDKSLYILPEIKNLETQGKGRTTATTRVMTENGITARIEQSPQTCIDCIPQKRLPKDYLSVHVTPTVVEGGRVHLQIQLRVNGNVWGIGSKGLEQQQALHIDQVINSSNTVLIGGLCQLTKQGQTKLVQSGWPDHQAALPSYRRWQSAILHQENCQPIYILLTPSIAKNSF